MMHKRKEFRIAQRNAHIKKKNAIICNTGEYMKKDEDGRPVFPVKGKLDKGKVHCLCGLRGFDRYTIQDRRRTVGMLYDLQDEHMEAVSGSTTTKLRKEANNSIRKRHSGAAYTQKTNEKVEYSYLKLHKKHDELTKMYWSIVHDAKDLHLQFKEECWLNHECLNAGQIHEANEHRLRADQLLEAAKKRFAEAEAISKKVGESKVLMDALLLCEKGTRLEKKILDKVQAMIA